HYALLQVSRIEAEELEAACGIRVLGETDPFRLARALSSGLEAGTRDGLPGPDDLDGWLALLAEDPARPGVGPALIALEQRLRRRCDYDQLVDLLLARVDVEPDRAVRAELLGEVARLAEHDLGDHERAFAAALRAYREAPARAAWEDLTALAEKTDGWADYATVLGECVGALPPEDWAEAWLRVARMCVEPFEQTDAAIAAPEAALALAPDAHEIAELHRDLLRQSERWPELAEWFERAAAAAGSAVESARLLAQAAEVRERHLGDRAA